MTMQSYWASTHRERSQRAEETESTSNCPGFSRGEGEFTIDPYEIDQDHWNEGFFRTGEE